MSRLIGERFRALAPELSERGRRMWAASEARVLLERERARGSSMSAPKAGAPIRGPKVRRERGPTTDWFGMPTNAVRAPSRAAATAWFAPFPP